MGSLAIRLLTGGGRGGRLHAALPVVAVAVATLLLLLVLGAREGFDARAERTAWRTPDVADQPIALQALHTDHVGDEPITVVELAALEAGPPAPPGMERFPQPDEVWVSAALADRIEELPADQLADRFPAAPTGTLSGAALRHPDELVAVVGRHADDPAMTAERFLPPWDGFSAVGPTGIDGWSSEPDEVAEIYQALAWSGLLVMVVPLLALGGAAARLLGARRNRRLSLLRLLGATTTQVAALTAAEAAVLGAVGAVIGGLAYVVSLPLATQIAVGGGGWFAADIWVGPVLFGLTLLAVTALVGVSALVTLAPVVRDPFATARAARPGRARLWRLAVLGVAVLGFSAMSSNGWRAVVVALVLVLASMGVAGPWAVRVLGGVMSRTARTAPRLLAGRRLAEDPRSGWRAVSGMVLAGFLAGFLAVAVPTGAAAELWGRTDQLQLRVEAGRAPEVADRAAGRLEAAGIPATVELTEAPWSAEGELRSVTVTLDEGEGDADLDRARTLLAGVEPGAVASTQADENRTHQGLYGDLRVGAVVVLVASFLVAAVATGVGGIARVLDQRGPLTLVRLAGVPVEVLAVARRMEVTGPLVLFGGGATLLGLLLGLVALSQADAVPDGRALALFAGLALAGVASILGADHISRPILRSATADLSERE